MRFEDTFKKYLSLNQLTTVKEENILKTKEAEKVTIPVILVVTVNLEKYYISRYMYQCSLRF